MGVFCTCWTGEDPFGREARNVRLIDLRQFGVAIAARVAMIRRPIGLRSYFAVAIVASLSQQMNAAVAGDDLKIVHAFVQHAAFERAAIGGLDLFANFRRRIAAWNGDQSTYVGSEGCHLLRGQIEGRHAACRASSMEEGGHLGWRPQVNLLDDIGSAFAARGIAPMTVRAARLKNLPSGSVRGLR